MDARERYIQTITFGTPDRIPLEPGGPRRSTLERWRAEGLPEGVNYMDHVRSVLGIEREVYAPLPPLTVDFRLRPWFEEKVLEHRNGHYIVQDWMGAITEISDEYDFTYIRNAVDFVTRKWHKFPVETRADWERMRERYSADDPSRVSPDIAALAPALAKRRTPLRISVNGPFWQMREWMGMENLCIAFIDQPELVAEMAAFWRDFVLGVFSRVLPYVQPDVIGISEDMAYKAHSMISPKMTREFLQPVYESWMELFGRHKVPVVDMDSDGFIQELIPIWIDCGINCCDPIEVAAHNDIASYRRQFGRAMAYCGGVDKRAIAAGGDVLRAEIARLAPVIKDGGYIPGCDHGVPHDISLANYIEHTRLLAELTGWL